MRINRWSLYDLGKSGRLKPTCLEKENVWIEFRRYEAG